MKSLILEKGKLVLKEFDIPKADHGEILVKMKACGICGTDIEKIKGFSLTNLKLGHEVTGEVAQVGEGVKDLKVGDRVFVHHHVSCGGCYYCKNNSETLCELFYKTNLEPCGFSEYFKVPKFNLEKGAVIKLNHINHEEGTFIEPLGCCIRNLRKSNFREGERVMVMGCGIMGLLHIMLLKLMGAGKIFALDVIPFRLRKAKELGAYYTFNANEGSLEEKVKELTEGIGLDLVIVATSNKKALLQAFNFVRKGGRISIFGAPFKGTIIDLDFSDIFIREIGVIPSYSTSEKETHLASSLLESKKLKVEDLVTHRFKLEDYKEAFRVAEEGKDSLKVLIVNP
ncbi:MAG: zinc-dependent dehydrogenase [Nitrososphaerales archaeon]